MKHTIHASGNSLHMCTGRRTGRFLACILLWAFTGLHAQDRPVITPAVGYFLDSVAVTITAPRPDVEIRYSTARGKQPAADSPLYTGPFTLKKTSEVRAQMFKDGRAVGDPASTTLRITSSAIVYKQHPWKTQPEKAALMLTFAHADDDGAAFTGMIPYHAQVRKVPIIGICVSSLDTPESSRWRRKELESAFWDYGMRNAPIFANFPDTDWSKHQAIIHFYEQWDFKKLVAYLVLQIRTYKPEVIVTHDFYGEYLHTHHLMTAFATHDAYFLSNDPNAFPEQLSRVEVWQAKKLYAHIGIRDRIEFDWSIPYPELGGKTPLQVARAAMIKNYLSQFVSQPSGNDTPAGNEKAKQDKPVYGIRYGLLNSKVGPDVQRNDFFENIDMSGFQP